MKSKGRNVITGILVIFLLFLAMTACRRNMRDSGGQDTQSVHAEKGEVYTIGVCVYSQEDPEMRMFMDYYRDYTAQGFPVKFYFSDKISSSEDELEFIDSMEKQGAQGIISFYGLDAAAAAKRCEQAGMYYMLGSGTISDENYQAAAESEYFLGTVGPDPDAEYEAGKAMGEYFASQGLKSYLIVTVGAQKENFMHLSRAEGILDALEESLGLQYGDSREALYDSQENAVLDTGSDEVSITLCPGYLSSDEGVENLKAALEANHYDGVLCAASLAGVMDQVLEKEKSQGMDMHIGMVDCFSAENAQLVKADDPFGNPRLNYVAGKYGSMIGPAFAIMYNAITGHPEANSSDGKAVRYYQGFWTAKGRSEFLEYYSYTQDQYENAYSNKDLMDVIYEFNENTSAEDLKALTQSYTVEDVKERISLRE